MLLPPGENCFGSDRSDLGQLLQLGLTCTIQIERALRGGASATTGPTLFSHLPCWVRRRADQHLLAVTQQLSKVEFTWIGLMGEPASRVDRILDS